MRSQKSIRTNSSVLNTTIEKDTKNCIKDLIKIKWQTHWLKQNANSEQSKIISMFGQIIISITLFYYNV